MIKGLALITSCGGQCISVCLGIPQCTEHAVFYLLKTKIHIAAICLCYGRIPRKSTGRLWLWIGAFLTQIGGCGERELCLSMPPDLTHTIDDTTLANRFLWRRWSSDVWMMTWGRDHQTSHKARRYTDVDPQNSSSDGLVELKVDVILFTYLPKAGFCSSYRASISIIFNSVCKI